MTKGPGNPPSNRSKNPAKTLEERIGTIATELSKNKRGPKPAKNSKPTGVTKSRRGGPGKKREGKDRVREKGEEGEKGEREQGEPRIPITEEERIKLSEEKLAKKLEKIEEGGKDEYAKLWKEGDMIEKRKREIRKRMAELEREWREKRRAEWAIQVAVEEGGEEGGEKVAVVEEGQTEGEESKAEESKVEETDEIDYV